MHFHPLKIGDYIVGNEKDCNHYIWFILVKSSSKKPLKKIAHILANNVTSVDMMQTHLKNKVCSLVHASNVH